MLEPSWMMRSMREVDNIKIERLIFFLRPLDETSPPIHEFPVGVSSIAMLVGRRGGLGKARTKKLSAKK